MAAVTIRNLPEETHRALKLLAAQHGHSTEAEIRKILEDTVRPVVRARVGSALAALGQFEDFVTIRDQSPLKPASFE